MAKGICKLTGKEGEFRKSHLYPKAFYRLQDAGGPLKSVASDASERPKRSRTGMYDPELVIAETEEFFAELDDHAIKLLNRPIDEADLFRVSGKVELAENGSPVGYWLKNIDTNRFRLFFLSLLWRFAASAMPETKGVDLGPHQDRIADCLRSNSLSGEAGRFEVIGSRFSDEQNVVTVTPVAVRFEGLVCWHMVFGVYEFYVKMDRRPFPPPFNDLCMRDDGTMPILLRTFRGTRFWRTLTGNVKAIDEKWGGPWNGLYPIKEG